MTDLVFVIPEPNTDAMVSLLHRVIASSIDSIAEQMHFSTGDAMGAAMYLVVEAGLENSTPEKLREDIIQAVDRILADRAEQKKAIN